MLCRCQQLTARQVLYLTSQVSQAGKGEVGQGMLHILIDTFTHALTNLPANPPNPTLAPPTVDSTAHAQQQLPNKSEGDSKSAKAWEHETARVQRNQGRAKPSSEQVRAESQQLLRQQRALEGESRHESMRQARRKLPAFGTREELLAQLRQYSVIIISGATGTAAMKATVFMVMPAILQL